MLSYVPTKAKPTIVERLAELFDHTSTTKALMSSLGDYWTAYFADPEVLTKASTGYVTAYSQEYRRLLSLVLQANIIDIPFRDTQQINLLVFSEVDAEIGTDTIVFRNTGIQDVAFLTSSLFEPDVILEQGLHFDIHNGDITFYVDIFNDPAITGSTYRFDEYPNRKVLFWGSDIALESTYIYERYGSFLYRKAVDSEKYKWLVTALMYFYTNTKSIKNIENVLNILYGVPFATKPGETVLDVYLVNDQLERVRYKVDNCFWCVETDYRKYYVYGYADIAVQPGDVLEQFQLMARFHTVDDYITRDKWWEEAVFPIDLVESDYEHMDRELREELMANVLKYNMIYVKLGVSHQTWGIFQDQFNEIKKIVDSGIPVYLYPLIGTVFKASFEDLFEVTDEFSGITGRMEMSSQYSVDGRMFDGSYDYSAGIERDHGRDSVEHFSVYDGTVVYAGPTADNPRGVHRPYYSNIFLFDGSVTYDPVIAVLHNSERDILDMTAIRTELEDAFPYSTEDGSYEQYATYSGDYPHEGTLYFGINLLIPKDFQTRIKTTLLDDMNLITDDFRLVVRRKSA